MYFIEVVAHAGIPAEGQRIGLVRQAGGPRTSKYLDWPGGFKAVVNLPKPSNNIRPIIQAILLYRR